MFQLAMLAYLRNLKIECLESVCISPASNYGVIFGVLLGKTYSQICPFWEHLRLAMELLAANDSVTLRGPKGGTQTEMVDQP